MGNRSLFPGVAVPLAFFCTLFFRHRKKSVSAPWDGQSQSAPESARQNPPREFAYGKVVSCHASRGLSARPLHPFGPPKEQCERPMGRPVPLRAGVGASSPTGGSGMRLQAHWGLSSGQTIGAVRTAVRSACCLPELRGANRIQRLCPLGTRFPTFPPAPPSGSRHTNGIEGLHLRAH